MGIVSTSEDQLNLDSLSTLKNNTRLTRISSGTITQSILRAVNKRFSQNNDLLNSNITQTFLSQATGDSLDLVGVMLNVKRGAAVNGSRANTQKFYVASGTFGDITGFTSPIPTGTIVQSSDGTIQYQTVGDISFTSTDSQVIGSIEAVTTGSSSNIGKGILTVHGIDVVGLLTTNLEAVDNGSSTQGDDEYRYILTKAVTAAEAANETAVRLASLSVSGVSEATIYRYLNGIGTFGVLIQGTSPIVSTSVLQDVYTAVNSVIALGESHTIRPPRYIGIEVSAKLIFKSSTSDDDKSTIASAVEDAVYDYINNIEMGSGFVRNELIQTIMDCSDDILDVDDDEDSDTCLSVHVWTPTTSDIVGGVTTTNRVREVLDHNYDPYFDDKHIVEQDVQGYTHGDDFTPVTITYE